MSATNAATNAVVWVDAEEARICVNGEGGEEGTRIAASETRHPASARSGSIDNPAGSPTRDNREYFEAILAEVENVDAWVIVGPDGVKDELASYLDGHADALRGKLVGVKPMGHAARAELGERGRAFFANV